MVPETGYEVDLLQCHSRGTVLALIVSAGGTCLELVPLGVDLSAVVVFAGAAAIVGAVVAAVVAAFGSDEIGGLNHSVMTEGTPVGSSGL